MATLEQHLIAAQNPVGKEQRRPVFKRKRSGQALTREQVKAIKKGRKLLRKEMRAKGLKEKSDFELTATSMGLYFDKHRALLWLRWFFHGAGLLRALILAMLLLLLTIPMDTVLNASKSTVEIIERYLRNGIRLVVDNYDPEKLPADQLKAMGFTCLRFAPELYMKQETANTMGNLRREGFTLIGGWADTHDVLLWQAACGVIFMGGTITGIPVDEDELIRDSLAREK